MPKMVLFWWFRKKLGTNIGHNSLNSMLGMLHDVRDKKYKNHDVGAIMGYLKAPKKGPFSKKKSFFSPCDYKSSWSLFKFEMVVPDYCNFLHVKLCGPP